MSGFDGLLRTVQAEARELVSYKKRMVNVSFLK